MVSPVERARRFTRVLELARQRSTVKRRSSCRDVYIGGQGDGNLGDEAMLEAARRLLPESELVSFAYAGQERQLALVGLSGARFFDSAILGGGTLINPHWVESVRTALEMGLRVWTLGTGVGSSGFGHPHEVAFDEWKELLDQFESIGVRGPLSKARLVELGLNAEVEVVGDLALGLTAAGPAEPTDPPRFALNLSASASGHSEPGLEFAASELLTTAREYVSKGWELVPVAMHRSDVAPTRILVSQILGRESTVRPFATVEDFNDAVATCRFLIGVRLHSAVLATCLGVPPVLLGYREKCLDFMQSMELSDLYVELTELHSGAIARVTRSAAERPVEFRRVVHERAGSWKVRLQQYVGRNRPERVIG